MRSKPVVYLETPGFRKVEEDNSSPDIEVREGDDAVPSIAETEMKTEPEEKSKEYTTRFSRKIVPPLLLQNEASVASVNKDSARHVRFSLGGSKKLSKNINLATATSAEINYLSSIQDLDRLEILVVGAGIGSRYSSTKELHPMKYKEALRTSDGEEWKKKFKKEHKQMRKNKVWIPFKISDLPKNTKVIDSTWACKKKSNRTLRGRITARGFKQKEGLHFNSSSLSLPVMCAMVRVFNFQLFVFIF